MNKIYKYILIGIGLFGLLFASCNADFINVYSKNINSGNINSFPANANGNALININQSSGGMYCLEISNVKYDSLLNQLNTLMMVNYSENFTINDIDVHNYNISYKSFYYATGDGKYINCFYLPWGAIKIGFQNAVKSNIINGNVSFDLKILYNSDNIFVNNCPTCTPQYTSEECQTEYGLVESGLLTNCQTDLNSCITNTSGFNDLLNNCNNNLNACNLSLSSCLQSNCPTTSGDISWSSLFINDIQHIGGPSIYIGIPEEIERDYEYVDNDMYITVDGYNVDNEYIADVIQKTKITPTSEDLSYMIQGLQVYIPYLFIGLIMIFTIALIKRFFRG